jgi:hypothetical protein
VTIDDMFAALWADYVALAPQAERVRALLGDRGEVVRDDHVALRTFGLAGLGLDALARPFEALGYMARDRYRFADKKLRARYWQHPEPRRPKVFISELVVEELTFGAQQIVGGLVAQLPVGFAARDDLAWAGRPWQVRRADYESLLVESEYAAWLAAFGFRVNHFTVDVNGLTTFPDLGSLNAFLVEHGVELNDAGGTIKGGRTDCLEQSSTRAEHISVPLADAVVAIPSCYYEFARRYPLPSGELFQGFVPASADKIFESTDVKR